MKNLIYIVIGAFIVASFFIGKSCNKPQVILDTSKIEALEEQRDSLEYEYSKLEEQDSLKALEIKDLRDSLKNIDFQQIAQIDSAIKKDSTESVKLARTQLNRLASVPVNYAPFDYYEYGLTAKYLSDIPPMKLKIHYLERLDTLNREELAIKDGRIRLLEKARENDSKIQSQIQFQVNYYKGLYDHTQSLFYHRFGLYTGVGASYSAQGIEPSIQFGVGLILWRND